MNRVIGDTPVPIKIWASVLENEAEQQLRQLATMPFIHKHVAVMPDAHAGRGSTVGTVIATTGAIIPAAVGVDIGCGMCAMPLQIPIDRLGDLKKLRSSIERSVPVGRESNRNDRRALKEFAALSATLGPRSALSNKQEAVACAQLGTLGGGNHFIEVCTDQEGLAWVMLHSGSRHIGKTLAEQHIERAQGLMKEYFIALPHPDLAYLVQGTKEFEHYLADLMWGQAYAASNRVVMMDRVLKDVFFHVYGSDKGAQELSAFKMTAPVVINCHHNYTAIENHFGKNIYVTRKGAIRARAGDLGIIPGSMGRQSYIVRGKGNDDSFHSCSHGAGRAMSRSQARRTFTKDDLIRETEGVECRKDEGVVDEIPSAYKDIDVVMADQADLVEPIHTLKQLLCVKG